MIFSGRGDQAAALLEAVDWHSHPLGTPDRWPSALKVAVRYILNSPESIYLSWGPSQTFFFNDAYLPILGPRVSVAMGANFPELWADAWPSVEPMVKSALNGVASEVVDFFIPMNRYGDPEDTWWSFSFSPWFDEDGAVGGILCLTNETTSHVLNAAEQLESESRNRQILDSAIDFAIIATDKDGRITRWNEGARRIVEWTEEEMLGQPADRFFTPEDVERDRVAIEMRAALETGRGTDERWHIRKSGERFWADGEMTVLRNEAGDPAGFVKVLRDRTGQRRAEEALKKLNVTLGEKVADEVDARIRAEEALRQSQKVEAIGQLTGGVAHDFNNLLTVIRGSVDLLRRGNLAEDRRARYIDAISDTTDRAVKLTGQLLAFARRQSLTPEVFDVGDNIEALMGMLGSLSGAGIDVVFHPCDPPCFVNADASQFDTALVNMAVNARDAMEGKGRLTIKAEPADLVPATRAHPAKDGKFVAISVADTGEGIPVEKLDRIFEPFFTTKAIGKGTGLGLSQVFGFAKQSGGDVIAGNVEGGGALLTIYLPRADEPEAGSHAPEEVAPSEATACVLVVEDNYEVGQFAIQALNELGHGTVLALDAAAALAELEKDSTRFDVVFTDVVMPGMGGVQLGEAIRQAYPDLPVILTSGYSTVLAENGDHGFDLLRKPYSIDQLSKALEQVARGGKGRSCNS